MVPPQKPRGDLLRILARPRSFVKDLLLIVFSQAPGHDVIALTKSPLAPSGLALNWPAMKSADLNTRPHYDRSSRGHRQGRYDCYGSVNELQRRAEHFAPARDQALLKRAMSTTQLDQQRPNEEIVAAILADLSEADMRQAAQGMLEDATAAVEALVLMGQEEESELDEAQAALQELKAGNEETWQLAFAVLRNVLTETVADARATASED